MTDQQRLAGRLWRRLHPAEIAPLVGASVSCLYAWRKRFGWARKPSQGWRSVNLPCCTTCRRRFYPRGTSSVCSACVKATRAARKYRPTLRRCDCTGYGVFYAFDLQSPTGCPNCGSTGLVLRGAA